MNEREQKYFNAGMAWALSRLVDAGVAVTDIERVLKVDEEPDLFTQGAWEGLNSWKRNNMDVHVREAKHEDK